VTFFGKIKEQWLQPFLYLGRNVISLIGGALTTSTAFIMIGFWVIDIFGHGGSNNPYLGIIIFLILPGLFVLGLSMIPIGIYIRRRDLLNAGQLPSIYPDIDFGDPLFRHALDFVIIATFINFVIIGVASYRGVSYMESPSFCGQACHVMNPEWTAYQVSPHSHVACTECHVGSGAASFVRAKVEGTRQLVEVVLNSYPRPIHAPLNGLRPARETCEQCHSPEHFTGEKLLVKTAFADDEKNSMTKSILVMHLGGVDSLSRQSGIHGHHLNHFEYVASDSSAQTILEVDARGADGSVTQYISADAKGPVQGVRRTMDCMDCHNQATHVFQTAGEAVDEAMTSGSLSADLPFAHKQGMQLVQTEYKSQDEAAAKIKSGFEDFYRTQYPDVWNTQRDKVERTAAGLVTIYKQNVFPEMRVTWGTYPNNIGHTNFPGCFRCHDGNHSTKDGSKTINNDCALCHNLLAVGETNPKLLNEINFQ